MSRLMLLLIGLIALALSAAVGFWMGQQNGHVMADDDSMTALADEQKPLYWYDPMMPDQHFDAPGKSPFMDMMLVPRYADSGGGSSAISIDPALQQSLGLRTVTVELDAVPSTTRVPATLQWDLTGEQRVTARVEGLVERVHVRTPLARVRRGQPLVTLLAPMLGAALAEYHALAAGSSPESRSLQAATRSRLQLLGLSAADIAAAAKSGSPRVVLRAPADGVLGELTVREGDTVQAGQILFRINATDSLWLEAQVPQADAGALANDVVAQVEVSAFPGVRFDSTVDAWLPMVDPATRTQTLRLVVPNADGRLAAGMFADVLLSSDEDRICPWVPSEALILTGRESRVIVVDEDGGFRPVAVQTGRVVGERTEILDGLSGGENIVISGQFLIDSEASLSGLLTRMKGDAEPPGEQP